MTYGICPECEQGKHGNCNGEAWNDIKDEPMNCLCTHERQGRARGLTVHPSEESA